MSVDTKIGDRVFFCEKRLFFLIVQIAFLIVQIAFLLKNSFCVARFFVLFQWLTIIFIYMKLFLARYTK